MEEIPTRQPAFSEKFSEGWGLGPYSAGGATILNARLTPLR
jgi:hypothetical protein